MTELIAVIVIIGIVSVVAIARFNDATARTRGTYDELLSQVQFARKLAVAQRRAIFVRVEAAQARLCYSAAGACSGADAPPSPSGAAPFTITPGSGVSWAPAPVTFQFDALGRYRDAAGAATAAPLVLTVSGDASHAITIEHETGYVR